MAQRSQFAPHVEPDEVAVLETAHREGRVVLVDGIVEIADGITAHVVGGHSPGQQVTVVSTSGSDIVLASDAMHFYEEFELDRPFDVIADLQEVYAAYDLLRGLAANGAVVVPGHDPGVATRFPASTKGPEGLAVRLA
jgi:glyoxylase-like metal-dependent hydrolase (beta-lactamase superfamily II)